MSSSRAKGLSCSGTYRHREVSAEIMDVLTLQSAHSSSAHALANIRSFFFFFFINNFHLDAGVNVQCVLLLILILPSYLFCALQTEQGDTIIFFVFNF